MINLDYEHTWIIATFGIPIIIVCVGVIKYELEYANRLYKEYGYSRLTTLGISVVPFAVFLVLVSSFWIIYDLFVWWCDTHA